MSYLLNLNPYRLKESLKLTIDAKNSVVLLRIIVNNIECWQSSYSLVSKKSMSTVMSSDPRSSNQSTQFFQGTNSIYVSRTPCFRATIQKSLCKRGRADVCRSISQIV